MMGLATAATYAIWCDELTDRRIGSGYGTINNQEDSCSDSKRRPAGAAVGETNTPLRAVVAKHW
jgi:hypothetical protein